METQTLHTRWLFELDFIYFDGLGVYIFPCVIPKSFRVALDDSSIEYRIGLEI